MAVDGCLSELEAGDFGEEEDENCEECAGLDHSIEGCCLFYKVSSDRPTVRAGLQGCCKTMQMCRLPPEEL